MLAGTAPLKCKAVKAGTGKLTATVGPDSTTKDGIIISKNSGITFKNTRLGECFSFDVWIRLPLSGTNAYHALLSTPAGSHCGQVRATASGSHLGCSHPNKMWKLRMIDLQKCQPGWHRLTFVRERMNNVRPACLLACFFFSCGLPCARALVAHIVRAATAAVP